MFRLTIDDESNGAQDPELVAKLLEETATAIRAGHLRGRLFLDGAVGSYETINSAGIVRPFGFKMRGSGNGRS